MFYGFLLFKKEFVYIATISKFLQIYKRNNL